MKKNMMVYVLAVLAVVWLPKSAASQNGSDAGSIAAGGIRDAVIALAADARSLLDTATLEFNCRLNPQTFCQAYIGGVTDTFIGLGREGILAGDGKRHLCVPNGVNGLQLARLFMKYVQDHPETLHEDAVPTIFLALYSAFPCPN